jgi:hypothetical protein
MDARADWLGPAPPEPEAEEADSETKPLAIIDPTSLAGVPVPDRRWIVDDWLGYGYVTALYGNGGIGKTLLAQMLMTSTATGLPWLGRRVERCRSLALFCEDDPDELHRRQDRINRALGCGFSDLGSMRWISGSGADNAFCGFDQRGSMTIFPRFYEIERAALAHGARLIVLDNAADLYGGNENDRGQVRRFVNLLAGLGLRCEAAVLLLAHPSRAGLASGAIDGGSTAWHNSVRARWTLAPEAAEDGAPSDGLILSRPKANYAPATDSAMRLRWADGVLAPADAPASGGHVSRAACEQVFMTLLARCESAGLMLSESRNAANFAPRIMAKRPDRNGYGKKEFETAMHALIAARVLEVIDYRVNGRPRRRLARAQNEQEGQE